MEHNVLVTIKRAGRRRAIVESLRGDLLIQALERRVEPLEESRSGVQKNLLIRGAGEDLGVDNLVLGYAQDLLLGLGRDVRFTVVTSDLEVLLSTEIGQAVPRVVLGGAY
jgi:hypothetical protein